MPYSAVILAPRAGRWFAEIRRDLRAAILAARVDPKLITVASRAPAGVADSNTAAVYLATPQGLRDRDAARSIDALLASGIPVVPVVREPWSFSDPIIPATLAAIQGIRDSDGGRSVSAYLMRALGLSEADRRVFISYGRKDSERIAGQLWTALTEHGFEVFLDRFGIRPGTNWQQKLDAELGDKAFVVVLESDAAAESRWVEYEVVYAIKNHLGLAVLNLPGSRADREFAAVPAAFRRRIAARDLIGKGPQRRLRASNLERVVNEIEAVHDEALRARRDYLLRSARQLVIDAGWQVTSQPDWTLLAEASTGQRELIRVAPRSPRPRDLRGLDADRAALRRSGITVRLARLVHECCDMDASDRDLVEWVAQDRDLTAQLLQTITSALGASPAAIPGGSMRSR